MRGRLVGVRGDWDSGAATQEGAVGAAVRKRHIGGCVVGGWCREKGSQSGALRFLGMGARG